MLCPESKGTDNGDQPLQPQAGLKAPSGIFREVVQSLEESEEMKDSPSGNSAFLRGQCLYLWRFEIKISLTHTCQVSVGIPVQAPQDGGVEFDRSGVPSKSWQSSSPDGTRWVL